MTTAFTVPAQSTPNPRDEVERWFTAHGVPHFTVRYSVRNRGPLIDYLVFAVLAWELAVAPWREASLLAVLLAPLVLALVALLCKPLARKWVERHEESSSRVRWRSVVALAPLVLILSETDLPAFWFYPWVDFATLFVLLLAAAQLFQLPVEAWDTEGRGAGGLRIVAVIAGVLAFFVAEDTFLVGIDGAVSRRFDFVPPPLFDTLTSVPPLIIAVAILVLSSHLTENVRALVPESTDPRHEYQPSVGVYVLSKMAPLGVLLLGGTVTVLHYAFPRTAEAAFPVIGSLCLLLVCVVVFYGSRRIRMRRAMSRMSPLRELVERPGAVTWVFLYLISYPLLMWSYFDLAAFGTVLAGWRVGVLIFVVNVAYLLLAWFIVGFGLDRIMVWSVGTLRTSLRSMFRALARGLPLLLVFATFLVLTAELWQVAAELDVRALLVVASILIAAAVLLMLVASYEEITARQQVVTTEEALRLLESDELDVSATSKGTLRDLMTSPSQAATPAAPIKGLARINLLIVLLVYECLALVPAAVIASVLFFAIGRVAVSPELAAEWIYGDGADPALGQVLLDASFWQQPWSRVALLLGALSLLYLAVTVIFDANRRAEFFDGAEGALRQRLAVRKVYMEHLVTPDDAPFAPPI